MKNIITYIFSYMKEWYKVWKPAFWVTVIMIGLSIGMGMFANCSGSKLVIEHRSIKDSTERAVLRDTSKVSINKYNTRLYKLFSKWDEILENDRKELVHSVHAISTALTIWIGLIAAICTILPIVLGINANTNFQHEMELAKEELRQDFVALLRQTAEKLREINTNHEQKMNKANFRISQMSKSMKMSSMSQMLSDLSVQIRVVSDLQEFDSKDRGTLTKPELLIKILGNVVEQLNASKLKLTVEEYDKNLYVGMLLMFCMLKRLLVSAECVFDGYELITLQRLRSQIDSEISKSVLFQSKSEYESMMPILISLSGKVKELFEALDNEDKK